MRHPQVSKGDEQSAEDRLQPQVSTSISPFSPLSLPILSETECRHYKAFFRAEENIIVKKTMDEFFEKTKTTIEVLAANMVHQKMIATIFFLNY